MAKSTFKIPASLGRSLLDHEINLSGGGWQIKPIAVKVILFWTISLFGVFWLLSNTFLKQADLWLNALIVIWWVAATAFLGKYSKTKELNLTSVSALLEYVPASSRRVITRRSVDPGNFASIAGINSIDESGLISWADGTVGQAYLVVGSASVLVFDKDRASIIDRVDAFWRKIDTTVELIWITKKEPQRVYRQLANLDRRNLALEVSDPELDELLQEQHAILTSYVGGSFTSIHQYLVIKGDNLEALRKAHTLAVSEADESALMIKQLTMLDGDDASIMLRGLYAVDNSISA